MVIDGGEGHINRVERVMNPPMPLIRPHARLRGLKVAPAHRVRKGKPGKATKARVRKPGPARGPGLLKGGRPATTPRVLTPAGRKGKPERQSDHTEF